jgi:hypothetical protein
MGGLLILTSALVPTLLWADLTDRFIWMRRALPPVAFGGIGFADELPQESSGDRIYGLRPPLQDGWQIGRWPSPWGFAAHAPVPGSVAIQHASDFPFFKAADSRPRWF